MTRIGWFSSGRGPGSRGLFKTVMDHISRGEIAGNIEFVFCTQEPGESENGNLFIKLVESFNIPIVCVSSKKFNSSWPLTGNRDRDAAISERRLAYDKKVMELLEPFSPDFCVLAGYMLIVGDEMCRRYDMINLHPALPGGPTGTWREVIWKLMENRASMSGVMIHLATPALDRGPVVTYCTYPITGQAFDELWKSIDGLTTEKIKSSWGEDHPLFKTIRKSGYERELPLIYLTLRSLCNNSIKISAGKVYDRDGHPLDGYDLTEDVDRLLRDND